MPVCAASWADVAGPMSAECSVQAEPLADVDGVQLEGTNAVAKQAVEGEFGCVHVNRAYASSSRMVLLR